MISIREVCPKMSDAIDAMIKGLREILGDNFKVDMESFGHANRGVCYGCAATCAIQQIAGKLFTPDDLEYAYMVAKKATALDMNKEEMLAFETAIDQFRMGNIWFLLKFYGIRAESSGINILLPNGSKVMMGSWYMNTRDYKAQLLFIEEWNNQLKQAGY